MTISNENFMEKDISFLSDGFVLKGKLHLPAVCQPPVVIGSHGLFSSKDSPKQIALARACNRLGMAYFRFDHRGCGGSQGEFAEVTSLASRCRDLKNAVEAIRNTNETGPLMGLFGSSMGGTVSLAVAVELRACAIVTFAAPVCSHVHKVGLDHSADPRAEGNFFDTQKQAFDISSKLPKIKNILIIHGDADETVALTHAREIYRLAAEPKKLIVQQSGDHRMSNVNHQSDFLKEASMWFKFGLLGK
ncbi:MAG: alpha/beta fold hydrolase [Desulfobacterales bacterium]|nr:MAG: alpha/beta fold hydrolase [Desulfobacterales bacterium]